MINPPSIEHPRTPVTSQEAVDYPGPVDKMSYHGLHKDRPIDPKKLEASIKRPWGCKECARPTTITCHRVLQICMHR